MNKKESLWDLAVQKNLQTDFTNSSEKSLIFVGGKGAGKSTVIQRFLDRNEVVKETLALEYNFGRKSGRSLSKETCSVWELGGGTLYLNLLDLLLGKQNTALILVLDLSQTETLWNVMETILTYVNNYHSKREKTREFTTHNRNGVEEGVTPFPMPLLIIGTKYDLFQVFEIEKKKLICKTLRSVAHSLSASLLFYSDKDPTLVKKLKDVLHYYGFGGCQWKGHCTDFNKPLLICAGSETFDDIGINKNSLPRRTKGLFLDPFKHTYTMAFPQVSQSANIPDDPVKDHNFKEPLIDTLRVQKDDELDRFLQELGERKKVNDERGFVVF